MDRDYINEKAIRLADDLDHGGGDLVAAKLRQDSIDNRMSDQDFARLVYLIQSYERPGLGDDLNLRPVEGGAVVSVDKVRHDNRGRQFSQLIPAGEIEFTPIYDEPYQRNGGGIDKKSAVIGGILGMVAGAVIEHQIDNHRDNHRNNDHGRRDDHGHNDHDHRDDRRYHHDNDRRR